jgi:hypothetical protein
MGEAYCACLERKTEGRWRVTFESNYVVGAVNPGIDAPFVAAGGGVLAAGAAGAGTTSSSLWFASASHLLCE